MISSKREAAKERKPPVNIESDNAPKLVQSIFYLWALCLVNLMKRKRPVFLFSDELGETWYNIFTSIQRRRFHYGTLGYRR